MTIADEPHRNVSLTPVAPTTETQLVAFKAHAPGVGMTIEHYDWIKAQVREEIEGTPTSSIWLAISLSLTSLCAALWIAALTNNSSDATKGKLEVAAWGCLLLAASFLLFHFVAWKGSKKRADALIKAIDVHCFRAPVPPAVEASARAAVGSGEVGVIRATYGDPAAPPDDRKNVTQIVSGLVKNGKLDFTADNNLLGGDPAKDIFKELEIQYRLAGDQAVYARTWPENAQVALP